MRWYHYLAYFFGEPSLRTRCPISAMGSRAMHFRVPFAAPPGKGCRPSTVNVLWGLFNLVYGVPARVPGREFRTAQHPARPCPRDGILVFRSCSLMHSVGPRRPLSLSRVCFRCRTLANTALSQAPRRQRLHEGTVRGLRHHLTDSTNDSAPQLSACWPSLCLAWWRAANQAGYEDPSKRIRAVQNLTDQAVLAKVAIEDKDDDVRNASVRRLTDQSSSGLGSRRGPRMRMSATRLPKAH